MDTKLQIAFFILSGTTFLLVLTGLGWAIATERRLKKFFLGKKAKDLEDTIIALEQKIAELGGARNRIEEEIALMNGKLRKSVRGLATTRFNPFPDQGSNQSFAIGMLDEEGNGLVMSSLYSRERMSIFAKPVKNGKSEYGLSAEEKEALEKAKVQ